MSEFNFIPQEVEQKRKIAKSADRTISLEIAYQLKRIADNLEEMNQYQEVEIPEGFYPVPVEEEVKEEKEDDGRKKEVPGA